MNLFAIATSGRQAATARLNVSASNAADIDPSSDSGFGGQASPVPPARPSQPQQLVQFSFADGGVGVQVRPTSVDDLGLDLVSQMQALDQFKANVKVFETGDQAMRSLLDLKA